MWLGGWLGGSEGVIPAGVCLTFESKSRICSPADGQLTLFNNAKTDFARLNFGGTTSSFPSIKRSTTQLHFRLADDSGYAGFQSGASTVLGDFTITGQTDRAQLTVTGAATQTNPILIIEQNGGTDLLTLDNAGDMTLVDSAEINSGAGNPYLWFDATKGMTLGYGAGGGFVCGGSTADFYTGDPRAAGSIGVRIRSNTSVISLKNTGILSFSNSATVPGTPDTGIERAAAGELAVTNGAGTLAILKASDLKIGTRTAAGTPASFSADYYIAIQDSAGNAFVVPGMAAAW